MYGTLSDFLVLGDKFRQYHSDPVNLGLHLLTTPLAVLAVFAALNKIVGFSNLTFGVTFMYLTIMSSCLSPSVFAATAVCCCVICVGSASFARLGYAAIAAAFCVGYFGQDLSHFVTGEQTFQSTYQQDNDFVMQLAEHSYYLIPLVFDAMLGSAAPARVQAPLLGDYAGHIWLLRGALVAFCVGVLFPGPGSKAYAKPKTA